MHTLGFGLGCTSADELPELGQLVRAVDLKNRELALGDAVVRDHRPASGAGCSVRQLAVEGGPAGVSVHRSLSWLSFRVLPGQLARLQAPGPAMRGRGGPVGVSDGLERHGSQALGAHHDLALPA